MNNFFKALPVLASPKFWGVALYFVVGWLLADGHITGSLAEMLQNIVGAATGVGVLDSIARKIGKR